MNKLVCVVPSCRPESMKQFRTAWEPLFNKHSATLITVWDGDEPSIEVYDYGDQNPKGLAPPCPYQKIRELLGPDMDLFCRHTDVVRNLGFWFASKYRPSQFLATFDDDCYPIIGEDGTQHFDPIQAHLDVLEKRVPISWMNTAHAGGEYLRGVPYGVRDEAPVMLSHGVWIGTPDFDGETQLRLESNGGVPPILPYYVGPVPKGVMFSVCGMNVMVRKEALPYLYFAPMGPDSGVEPEYEFRCSNCYCKRFNIHYKETGRCVDCESEGKVTTVHTGLHRFGDIWMGVSLKKEFDWLGWAIYTGASVIHHTRASDAGKNMEQEKLGREWNERVEDKLTWYESLCGGCDTPQTKYFRSYADKRERYRDLILSLQEGGGK